MFRIGVSFLTASLSVIAKVDSIHPKAEILDEGSSMEKPHPIISDNVLLLINTLLKAFAPQSITYRL